jgi:hypothetical protein
MNDDKPIHWNSADLSIAGACMYYSGRLRIDAIRGTVYLPDLDGEPSLDEVLLAGQYDAEIRIIRRITINRTVEPGA